MKILKLISIVALGVITCVFNSNARASSQTEERVLSTNKILISQNFDFSAYKSADLDDLLNNPPDVRGMRVFKNYKIAIEGELEEYPKQCDTNNLKTSMRNVWGITDPIPVSSCIKVKTKQGRSIKLFIQDAPANYIAKEVKLHQQVKLYSIYVYYGNFDLVTQGEDKEQFGIMVGTYKPIE
jgi:hypothetical protein